MDRQSDSGMSLNVEKIRSNNKFTFFNIKKDSLKKYINTMLKLIVKEYITCKQLHYI